MNKAKILLSLEFSVSKARHNLVEISGGIFTVERSLSCNTGC